MISYGIDIGTTTLRATAIEVCFHPFGRRSYSPHSKHSLCLMTPFLKGGDELDIQMIIFLIQNWIEEENLKKPDVGTLLFTGEVLKAKNTSEAADKLASIWSGLLSAQVDSELESRVSAFGSLAVELSQTNMGKTIVHMDIGGGTSNMARIEDGKIIDTSCLDIGCRKWVIDQKTGAILRKARAALLLEEALPELKKNGEIMTEERAKKISERFSEMILDHIHGNTNAFLRKLTINPWKNSFNKKPDLVSISGGVAECIKGQFSCFEFGDLGPVFSKVIENQLRINNIPQVLSSQEGRATALGVSAYGFQASGNSIYFSKEFPREKSNIPLYTSEQWLKLSNKPLVFAIELGVFGEVDKNFTAIQEKVMFWRVKFKEFGIGTGHIILFILRENLGKSFGYFLNELMPKLNFCVLDEIELDAGQSGIRVLDIRKPLMGDRYLVTVKCLAVE